VIHKAGKKMAGVIGTQTGQEIVVQSLHEQVVVLADGVGRQITIRAVSGGRQIRYGKKLHKNTREIFAGKAGALQQIGLVDAAIAKGQDTRECDAMGG
jgi:hypothetical protein